MHIGELADRTGLSLRTIRHYDEVGLLPASSRTEGGFRVYTNADCERLLVIMQMKPLGFSLEEMAELIPVLTAGPGTLSDRDRARLAAFQEKAVHQRAKLARNLAQADQLIARLGELA
ncbi:MerR family transcriptional regulator [Pseudarthrobacter sp. NPDC058362]|uniref:MerR family transcriptional regulator n=1 Tax=unclassified Pseudarthrobacter TaxID=2647000 RepID=UPI00365CC8EE